MLYCEGTQHTPQSSRDFPVSFASPGSGKSPSGLPGSFECPEGYRGGVFRKVPLGISRFIKCPEGYRGGVWGGEGGFERGRERTRYFEGPLPFWSPFFIKKASSKKALKKTPHSSIFRDPKNPQKAARAEFEVVSDAVQKSGPRPGVETMRFCYYLLHFS